MSTETCVRLDWEILVKLQPELAALERRIRKHASASRRRGTSYCANREWYGYRGGAGFRQEMRRLVGWESPAHPDPRVRSSEAFDIVYQRLYAILPDCRHEGSIC